MAIDLKAIREIRLMLAVESSNANKSASLMMDEAGSAIDALIAEVERLRCSTLMIGDAIGWLTKPEPTKIRPEMPENTAKHADSSKLP